jgi:dihydrofolate reductase
MTELLLIAAVARNGVIGRGGQMPWRLPEDLRYLREQTLGCPVIMGRKTWDSLPARFRPLPGRHNIVVTRQPGWQAEGATTAPGLDQALEAAGKAPRVFVIGGAELYAQALPRADTLLLTELDLDVEGDTRFPAWDRNAYVEATRERHTSAEGLGFSFVRYRKI